MPPKPKYSADAVLDAAKKIIREQGIDNLSAREVATALGSTTAPIFTYYGSMEALVKAAFLSISEECSDYFIDAVNYFPSAKEFAIRWIRFAMEYPNYYEVIFIRRGYNLEMSDLVRKKIGMMITPILGDCCKYFDINLDEGVKLMKALYVLVSGTCLAIINNVNRLSKEDIESIISEVGISIVNGIYIRNESFDINRARALFKSVGSSTVKKEDMLNHPGFTEFWSTKYSHEEIMEAIEKNGLPM